MSFDDLKNAMPNSFSAKIVATALTIGISSGGTLLVSDHSAISGLTEDIHNLVTAEHDSKADTFAAINRIVGIQEEQDREISRLEQAMRDKVKAEFPPPP